MSIELSPTIEEDLRDLAGRQGREVETLAEEAVRTYLEAAAITDLGPEQVAEAQLALIAEMSTLTPWKARDR